MIVDQLRILLLFLVRPTAAASLALDRANPVVAAVLAAIVAFLLRSEAEIGLSSLIVVVVVLVPVAIFILAMWQDIGNPGTTVRREYFVVLPSVLLAWSAAHLLLAAGLMLIAAVGIQTVPLPLLRMSVFGIFSVLAGCCFRVALGAKLIPSIITSVIAGAVAQGATFVLTGIPFIGSPWILYLLFIFLAADVRFGLEGVRRRQSFRRFLETSTLNPRDADAHYQLGLLYLQRRNNGEAEARLRKAVEIDGEDPDYLYQLGRLLNEQGKVEEANGLLERAAKINPKTSSHEVWREIGAVRLSQARLPEALEALRYYTGIREYDPHGLVLLGNCLAQSGQKDAAREVFQNAVTAAQTSPAYRRHEVRPWERKAREQLKGL